jgi:hypothetical protein
MPTVVILFVVVLVLSVLAKKNFFPKQSSGNLFFGNRFKSIDQLKSEDPSYGKFIERGAHFQIAVFFSVVVGVGLWFLFGSRG